METKELKKITVYRTTDMFGSVVKNEGYLIDYGVCKYAQYNNAPFVSFIPKGKKNGVKIIKDYNPYLMVLDGWNKPEPKDMFSEKEIDSNDVTIRQSTYLSFSEKYKTDFDKIAMMFSPSEILLDYRTTANTQIINK